MKRRRWVAEFELELELELTADSKTLQTNPSLVSWKFIRFAFNTAFAVVDRRVTHRHYHYHHRHSPLSPVMIINGGSAPRQFIYTSMTKASIFPCNLFSYFFSFTPYPIPHSDQINILPRLTITLNKKQATDSEKSVLSLFVMFRIQEHRFTSADLPISSLLTLPSVPCSLSLTHIIILNYFV